MLTSLKKFIVAQRKLGAVGISIFSGAVMEQFLQIAKAVGGMPTVALISLVILAAFGLAAYAISAVVKISGKYTNDK